MNYINLLNEVKSLESEVLERSRTCVKGENYVIVTKDLNVTVLNQDQHNTNFLISFPAQCTSKIFHQEIETAIQAEKQL